TMRHPPPDATGILHDKFFTTLLPCTDTHLIPLCDTDAMKKLLVTVGLAMGIAVPHLSAETLRLKLEPDRTVVLKGSPQEVVVKIDLEAVQKKKAKRTPLNIAVVLDRSGSMTGAKIEKARQAALQVVERLAPDDIFSL